MWAGSWRLSIKPQNQQHRAQIQAIGLGYLCGCHCETSDAGLRNWRHSVAQLVAQCCATGDAGLLPPIALNSLTHPLPARVDGQHL
uniref:Uncharacterized protein n=1 Tax=Romanomermis culicivorax TaxID=13658 RepID=A0A915IF25_ROMCU